MHGGQSRPHTDLSVLVVTIDPKENAKHSDNHAILLWVPNRLLFSWYQNNTVTSKYVSLINLVILDKNIQFKPENEDVARKLKLQACSVFAAVSKKSEFA